MFYHRKEVLPQSVCECVKDGHMEKQDILERIYEALEISYISYMVEIWRDCIFACSAKHSLFNAYKEHVVIYMQIEIFFRDMQLLVHRMQKLNKQYYVGLRMI